MATAGHFAIQTPRSEEGQTVASLNEDDISFGSAEASWISPSKLKKQPPAGAGAQSKQDFIARLTKPTGNTPLAEIKNASRPARVLPIGKQEFTPMLKSVTKNQFLKRGMFTQTPSKLRHVIGKSASTSNLPDITAEGSGEFSIMPDEEGSATQNEKELAEMSNASVSGINLPSRSPGSADGAAILTLREQEKVIDEMRKENFSLKLKIYFMQERLQNMAPEHIQAVLKENVEYKVEQATLRNDLKKYKRALLEAERNVAKMAEEIKNTRNSTDPSFVCPLEHGMSEEEAAMLRAAQDEAEEYKNEVMFAKQEIENLKRELWEVKREKQELENSSPEDIVHLENQIDELKGQKEDLEMENNNLKEEVGQKDDEIDLLQDRLAEQQKKVEDLKSRGVGPADDDELAQQLQESQEEIRHLNEKIAEVQGQLERARQNFQSEKEQLQSMAAEHKATCEKVENDLHELQNAYNNLDKELDEKQEEIEHYHNQLAGHSISGGERELNRQIKDLQEEVKQLEVEKADMMDQIQTLQHDAATLIEKDGKAARERSEQRKMLQNDIEELQIQLRESLEEKERAEQRFREQADRLEERLKDAEQHKASLKKQIENYINDEHTMQGENAKIQRALRDENERHKDEVASLQKQIDNLTRDAKNHNDLAQELEAEIMNLNEEIRTAKRTESSLNDEIQRLQQKAVSGGRDSELLRKLQAENAEFKQQISSLQTKLETVAAQKDRVMNDLAAIQSQLDHTRAETENFGSIRAERDDLRKSTIAAQINVAKLRAQVNDLTSRGAEHNLAIITQERDTLQSQVTTLRSQLEDAKRQADLHASRLRTMERNLADTKEDLEREREHAKKLLDTHLTSPNSDRTRRLNAEVRRLEDLLQQSRLRQAELGKINATQLDEIDVLNRRIEWLEGELDAAQSTHIPVGSRDEKELHKQLTLAKGQLAEVRAQLASKQRELERRAEDQAEGDTKNVVLEEEKRELKDEIERLKQRNIDAVQTRMRLEEQVRSLTRQVSRLESDLKIYSAADGEDKDLFSRLQSVKKELELVREDAEQKDVKSQKHIRKLQLELDDLRDQADSLTRDLHHSQKETERHHVQTQFLRKQLQESRDALKRLKNRTIDEHAPSALTMQVEKRHNAELKGLGKQIRYLKARLFREESFRLDLQFAKKFFLMQIGCFESCNQVNLQLLRQMGIYPDPRIRDRRPKLRSVALFFIAIARMKRLKNDWAEHRNGGKELKESLKRLKGRRAILV